MPVRSPEAIERDRVRRNRRKREKRRAIKHGEPFVPLPKPTRVEGNGSRYYRLTLPRQPEMSKAQLREMLAKAFQNTARM